MAQNLQRAGRIPEAEAEYRAVLAQGDAAEALQGLGVARYQQGDAAGALDLLRAALALRPDARAAYNAAVVLTALDRRAEVIDLLRPLVLQQPTYLAPYGVLSLAYEALGDRHAAGAVTQALLQQALGAAGVETVAETAARLIALEYEPADTVGLANRLRVRGLSEPASQLLQARLARAPGDLGARLALAMSRLTVVHESEAEIDARRDAYARDLQALTQALSDASPEQLIDGARSVGDSKPFYLSYHGCNDRPLQQAYGAAVSRMMRQALGSQPALAPRTPGARLRVGFATGYFHLHSVSKLFGGWVRHLDRGRFELFGYAFGSADDDCGRSLAAACDHFAGDFADHEAAARAMLADRLDVVLYPEIGMHPTAVKLACRRLAPVQCVAWGHPVTSGLPDIDYFLTSDLMEPADGQEAYTERLVRLPGLSICYDPLPSEGGRLTRADLGLGDEAVVYVCCQALYKYLPRHDAVIAAIARQVPAAQFLFIGAVTEPAAARLRRRLAAALVQAGLDPDRHLVFTPGVSVAAFSSLLRAGDVYLDSLGWSGGNTTLEAVTCDLPVVTTPTDLMRGRHSAAILSRMGLAHAVSPTLDAYVARAAALADPGVRAAARAEVQDNKHRLFGDLEPVRALEAFLIGAVEAASLVGDEIKLIR